MRRNLIYSLLLILFIADLSYSFLQYSGQSLDGDMAWNIVPNNDVKPILESPLGIAAITDTTYANPNRFFCHYVYREYMLKVPALLRHYFSAIESVYLACALSKILVHLLLIVVLALYVKPKGAYYWVFCLLCTILFQANGYRSYMGIIDPTTTYTFFYALPLLYLLVYFLPLFRVCYLEEAVRLKPLWSLIWVCFSFVVCLSGPLNPGVVLIIALLLFSATVFKNRKILASTSKYRLLAILWKLFPSWFWLTLIPAVILSLYSLFLGLYNSITIENKLSFLELYSRLPMGVYNQFTQKLGYPLLLISIAINVFLLRKMDREDIAFSKIRKLLSWFGIFSLCYILLLPLGGYRPYRFYILRYDTILPITISCVFLFAFISYLLLKLGGKRFKYAYVAFLGMLGLVYTIADKPGFEQNVCEKMALNKIVQSTKTELELQENCTILNWDIHTTTEEAQLNAELLYRWKITPTKKMVYNNEP